MGRVMRGQLCSREHIDEAARAMHAQRLAPLQAAQAHRGRMLVARAGQDGHGQAQQLGARAAEVLHVLAQAGQQFGGKLQRVQPVLQVAVIAQRIGVARGHVGGRGDHGARIRQMPQQPGVDGAEGQAALLPGLGHGRAFAQLVRGPQVGRTHAHGPARVTDQPGIPVAGQQGQFVAVARVLPDHDGRQRTARGRVPEHGRAALVGNGQGHDLLAAALGAGDGAAAHVQRALQQQVGVLLDHAGARAVDFQRQIVLGGHLPVAPHDGGARARGAFVDAKDHGFMVHGVFSFRRWFERSWRAGRRRPRTGVRRARRRGSPWCAWGPSGWKSRRCWPAAAPRTG